jgi:hypothetical protein
MPLPPSLPQSTKHLTHSSTNSISQTVVSSCLYRKQLANYSQDIITLQDEAAVNMVRLL